MLGNETNKTLMDFHMEIERRHKASVAAINLYRERMRDSFFQLAPQFKYEQKLETKREMDNAVNKLTNSTNK